MKKYVLLEVFDMGMILSWIAYPLGFVMKWCYSILSDYGLAILLFTLISKIIILPVGIWVHKNAIKIVEIQPAINRLKAKFYGDKERIGEEQAQLYKKKKYNPFASIIPLVIQIVLLLGVVQVIYNPLEYIVGADANVITQLEERCAQLDPTANLTDNSIQIKTVNAIKANPEAFADIAKTEEGKETIMKASELKLDILGFDLTATPSVKLSADFGSYWYMILCPVIAGISSWALCFIQNKINVLQAEQGKVNKWSTMTLSVGLSLFLGFFVPAGIALYWIASNVIAILQLLLLNQIIPPKNYVDYEELEASRAELRAIEALEVKEKKNLKTMIFGDENTKREKADYKRFFSISGKHLVFYSEKSGFYKYFENTIDALLRHTNIVIHYVTNDPKDAIFAKAEKNPRIQAYYIGPKKIITFMMKMDAEMVIMTTPDLETYYIKRSYVKKDTEYIYTFHGPASTNMVVREGAYDHFDTVFCVGPHQVEELRETEKMYNLPEKTLVPTGFGVIENLIEMYEKMEKKKSDKKQILLAPSWQEDNILDSCLDEMMEGLLHKGNRVILRPHPEYVKRFPHKMEAIVSKYEGADGDDFIIETDFSSNRTIWESDLLITDWSGIAYEYSYATKKPSLFINTPMKVLNPNYDKYKKPATDITWRDEVGVSVDTDKLSTVADTVAELLSNPDKYKKQITDALNKNIFNLGESGIAGAEYIYNRLCEKQKNASKKR